MQINKFAGMLYEINENEIRLHVTEKFSDRPDLHIEKTIDTNNTGFWDFVFDAIIEAKEHNLIIVKNEFKQYSPDAIALAELYVEKYRMLEKAFSGLSDHATSDLD